MRASRSYLLILLALLSYNSLYAQSRPQRETPPDAGQQPSQESPAAVQSSAEGLKNQDVIDMVKAGLSENVIVAKIKASPHAFRTDIGALKELKEALVPEPIVTLMIELSSAKPTSGPEPAAKEETNNKPTAEGFAHYREVAAAEKIVGAIRRLDNATAVGVLFQNYSSLLIESKSIVDENIKDVSDPEFRSYVENAMVDYQYAMYVWNLAVANGWSYFYTKKEPGRTLITKYGVPIKISIWTQLPVLTGLAHVWLSARGKFNIAENRLSRMKEASTKQ